MACGKEIVYQGFKRRLFFFSKRSFSFEIPRPLCLKGLHFSLYPLLSEKGQIDYEGNPLRQG